MKYQELVGKCLFVRRTTDHVQERLSDFSEIHQTTFEQSPAIIHNTGRDDPETGMKEGIGE